jgi:hypothetical protein
MEDYSTAATGWGDVQMQDWDNDPNSKGSTDIDGPSSTWLTNVSTTKEGFLRTVDQVNCSSCGSICGASYHTFIDIAVKCSYFTRSGVGLPDLCHSAMYVQAGTRSGANDHVALGASNSADVGRGVAGTTSNGPAIDYTNDWGSGPTLVDLLGFGATSRNGKVFLSWKTASEIDNAGFNVLRQEAENPATDYARINDDLIPAKGGPTEGARYSYKDADVTEGQTYNYKLEDIDTKGDSTLHGPVSATVGYIHLLTPEDGASVTGPPTFTWESSPFDRFAVQFSRRANYGTDTLTFPPPRKSGGDHRWTKETSYTPNAKQWKQIKHIARKDGTVFWRVVGKGPHGNRIVSDANKLDVK